MANKDSNKYANKLVNAFLNNRIIYPIPKKYTKKLLEAQKFRKLCESKITKPVIGFKAAGTGITVLKKLKEKEPFYATVYKHNVLKNKKSVKINKYTMGIELEVCYVIKKNFFNLKSKITKKNIKKFISYIAPCIEIVGYRQKKKGIKTLGDLCSDFGANVKFVVGPRKKFKNNNVKNLKTILYNKKINHLVTGNTNTVYIDPMNSLFFVLKKLQIDKLNHDKDFYVFTGSTVGVVPILGNGIYKGVIDKLGIVSTKIN
jgi:2-keto-4-pentenoate hydratase